jgi:outer membrane receptor protein involved in Fe transport
MDGEWDLTLWVKNATDELNTNNLFLLFGTKYLVYAPPRTFGLTYRYNF